MWANAQRDGHPAECRWRPVFNAASFGWCLLLECHAVKLPRRKTCWICWVPQTRQQISARKLRLMPTTRVPCSKAAKTQNLLNLLGAPDSPTDFILWGGDYSWGDIFWRCLPAATARLSMGALPRHTVNNRMARHREIEQRRGQMQDKLYRCTLVCKSVANIQFFAL